MSKLYVDEIHPKTTGSAVKRPSVPAWRISRDTDQSMTASGELTVEWDNTDKADELTFMNGNVTIDSSYRVVVPVAGLYQVNTTVRFDNVGSGYINIQIIPDDASSSIPRTYVIDGSPAGTYQTLSASDVFKLNAGSTLKVVAISQTDTSYTLDERSHFSGFLIG